jgi:hypothetical protein
MRRTLPICVVLLGLHLLVPTVRAEGKTQCESVRATIFEDAAIATASTWANLRGSESSIAAVTKRMLEQAFSKLENAKPPDAAKCGSGCTLSGDASVLLTSVPQRFLKNYADADDCERLLKQTTSSPLLYSDKKFPDLEELNSWFSSFSQGKGTDGNDLYRRCSGSCSPQYKSSVIKKAGNDASGSYVMSVSVVCGHARDKADDQYVVKVSAGMSCVPLN